MTNKQKTKREYRPRAATLEKLVKYLGDQGLDVAGPFRDLETGEYKGGCMSYSAEDILRVRELED